MLDPRTGPPPDKPATHTFAPRLAQRAAMAVAAAMHDAVISATTQQEGARADPLGRAVAVRPMLHLVRVRVPSPTPNPNPDPTPDP